MPNVNLPAGQDVDLYSATGILPGTRIRIDNNVNSTVRFSTSQSGLLNNYDNIEPMGARLLNPGEIGAWVNCKSGGIVNVTAESDTSAFFEGREFRFDIDPTAPVVVKFSSSVNFILRFQSLVSHDGIATFTAYRSVDGTPGGTFSATGISNLPNNAMDDAPAYVQQTTITKGGTFTPNGGAIPREFIKSRAATATAQQTTVGGNAVPERGLPPGDYYLMFTGIDTSYRLVYEERP
ncbi:MAG: hypothetical protein R3309_10035 [Reinekea sp.]|nr:hypothetical protein [Reinekea sp.]